MPRTSLNLPDPLWEEVRQVAEAQDRSITWIVKRALQEFVDSCSQPVGGRDVHSPRGMAVEVPVEKVHVASDPEAERARHEASLGRADRPEEMGVVDEARREVTPNWKGGTR